LFVLHLTNTKTGSFGKINNFQFRYLLIAQVLQVSAHSYKKISTPKTFTWRRDIYERAFAERGQSGNHPKNSAYCSTAPHSTALAKPIVGHAGVLLPGTARRVNRVLQRACDVARNIRDNNDTNPVNRPTFCQTIVYTATSSGEIQCEIKKV
jgi:hypothetical protein